MGWFFPWGYCWIRWVSAADVQAAHSPDSGGQQRCAARDPVNLSLCGSLAMKRASLQGTAALVIKLDVQSLCPAGVHHDFMHIFIPEVLCCLYESTTRFLFLTSQIVSIYSLSGANNPHFYFLAFFQTPSIDYWPLEGRRTSKQADRHTAITLCSSYKWLIFNHFANTSWFVFICWTVLTHFYHYYQMPVDDIFWKRDTFHLNLILILYYEEHNCHCNTTLMIWQRYNEHIHCVCLF